MRSRVRTAGVAFALLASVCCAVPAVAHAVLEESIPAAGERVDRAPATIVLSFDEPVETSLGSLRVLDAAGRERAASAAFHPGGDPSRIAIRLAPVERGRYTVAWRVVSSDSHLVGGAFAFGVGVPAGEAPPFAADPAGVVLTAIVHFALIGAALLAIGLPIGALVLRGAGGPAGAVEFGAWFVLGIAAFADVAVRAQLNAGTIGASFDTHAGVLRALTMIAAVCGIVALVGRTRNWFALFPAGALAAISLGLAGHAADGAWPALGVTADVAHLIAAAAWIGVIAVGLTGARGSVLGKISPAAAAAVGVLVLSGIVQTVRNAGSWTAMVDSGYGRAIDLKIAAMLAALAIALTIRRSLRRGTFAVRRRLLAESAVLAFAVAVTAVLVDLPLPREAVAAGASSESVRFRVRDVDVSAVIEQRDPHQWSLHVEGRGANGAPRSLDAVDVSLAETATHTGPLTVPVTRAPGGGYDAAIAPPFVGTWTLVVRARSGDFDENHITLALEEPS